MDEQSKKDNDKAVFQAIFDKVCPLLIQQGKGSMTGELHERACVYRGPDGLKCAIGHILSDAQIEQYSVQESDIPPDFHEELLKELLPNVQDLKEGTFFLRRLQGAHDNAALSRIGNFMDEFRTRARLMAKDYGLNDAVLYPIA